MLCGLAGGICLASNNNILIILGIIIFSKVAIDGTDSLLARVKYKATKLGALLDE